MLQYGINAAAPETNRIHGTEASYGWDTSAHSLSPAACPTTWLLPGLLLIGLLVVLVWQRVRHGRARG